VEALELVGSVGGQADGVAVIGKLPPSVQDLAAQNVRRPAVQTADLPPQYVPDLAKGWGDAEYDGGIVAIKEPQDCYGGAVSFPQSVARLNRHPPVFKQRGKHLLLFAP